LLQVTIIEITIIIINGDNYDTASGTFHHETRLSMVHSAHDFALYIIINKENPEMHPFSDTNKATFWI
jgi:hypothetical protein